jgi:DNA repair protein RadC
MKTTNSTNGGTFAVALKCNALSSLTIHHPNTKQIEADIEVCKKIKNVRTLGILLIDHLIITKTCF